MVSLYLIIFPRVFSAIAAALDCPICVTTDKHSVLACLEDPWLEERARVGWQHSRLHILPMNKLNTKVGRVAVQKFLILPLVFYLLTTSTSATIIFLYDLSSCFFF